MGMVMFYHLTRATVEEVALMLAPKALAQGWRVMLRAADKAALQRLDRQLWQGGDDAFLPHGLEGGPHDADQPLLLGQGAAINGARAVLVVGALPINLAEAAEMDRIWLVFEDGDPTQVAAARTQWKAITDAGLPAQYWNDASGQWEKKAQSPKP